MSKRSFLALPIFALATALGCDGAGHLSRPHHSDGDSAAAGRSAGARRTADTLQPIAMARDSQRDRELARTTGTLVGRVTLVGSGIPLPDVTMAGKDVSGATDSVGAYEIARIRPGRHVIHASRTGYLPRTRVVVARAGKTDTLDWQLRPGPPACCRLAGTWAARLLVDSPGTARTAVRTSTLAGTIVFSDRYAPAADPEQRPDPTERVKVEFGRFQIDLSLLFRHPAGQRMPTWPFADDTTLSAEAAGQAFMGDSVNVVLIPRLSHGSVAMWGVLRHDTVRGRWKQMAYHNVGPGGRFVMVRTSGPAATTERGIAPPSTHQHRE